MGWSSGSEVATRIWDSVKDCLDPIEQKKFAKSLIDIMEDQDCDTMYECEEIQAAAKLKIKKAGFTLIELMIVISIISILSAIAIPKYTELLHKAAVKRCSDGDEQSCTQLQTADFDAIKAAKEAQAAASAPAEPTHAKTTSIKGHLTKVTHEDGGDWYGVLSMDNGTSVGITVKDLISEGTTVCVAYSYDRTFADSIQVCQ